MGDNFFEEMGGNNNNNKKPLSRRLRFADTALKKTTLSCAPEDLLSRPLYHIWKLFGNVLKTLEG